MWRERREGEKETRMKLALFVELTLLFHISSKAKIMPMTLINREQAEVKYLSSELAQQK